MSELDPQLLETLPNDIIIHSIFPYVYHKANYRNRYGFKIKDLFGYFDTAGFDFKIVYKLWSSMQIDKKNIKNMPPLDNLKYLELINCDNIRSISQLPKLVSLKICNCENIEKFYQRNWLNPLTLYWYHQITSLCLYKSNKIEVIPPFPQLTHLSITLCGKIKTIHQYNKLITLRISYCDRIEEIPKLSNLTSLFLIQNYNVFMISKLDKLSTLIILECINLKSVQLTSKEKVYDYFTEMVLLYGTI